MNKLSVRALLNLDESPVLSIHIINCTYTSSIVHYVKMKLYAHSQKESSTDNNDNVFITRVKSFGTIHFNLDTTNRLYLPSVG